MGDINFKCPDCHAESGMTLEQWQDAEHRMITLKCECRISKDRLAKHAMIKKWQLPPRTRIAGLEMTNAVPLDNVVYPAWDSGQEFMFDLTQPDGMARVTIPPASVALLDKPLDPFSAPLEAFNAWLRNRRAADEHRVCDCRICGPAN